MLVDLVHVETCDGVRLDGTLRRASDDVENKLGVDIVILHHGVTGNFYNPGMFDQYSDAILKSGCSVLQVNNRGHDPIVKVKVAGTVKKYGAAYEVVDECRYDFAAWIDFAEKHGFRDIGIWGHSLGAVKSIYYMALEQDKRVKVVVACSPPRFSCSGFIDTSNGEDFSRILSQAEHHVRTGSPDALMEVTNPYNILISADVFIQKYGPAEKYNVLKYIPSVRVPLLVTIGTEESKDIMAFEGLSQQVAELSNNLDNMTFESVPGADHVYTDQRDYLWNVVSQWIAKNARDRVS